MFCGKCGREISEQDKFCPVCGFDTTKSGDLGKQADGPYAPPPVRTAPPGPQPITYPGPNPPAPKNYVPWIVAVILIIVVAAAAAGAFLYISRTSETDQADEVSTDPAEAGQADPNQSGASEITLTPIDPEDEPVTSEPATPAKSFDVTALNRIIAGKTAVSNVAVAVQDLGTKQVYATSNADMLFISSGFYVPVYLAAQYSSISDSSIYGKAGTMMSTMDNTAANAVIDSLGGLDGINRLLRENGYVKTTFGRKFGDVEASRRGSENYTSAKEAGMLLEQLYNNGGYSLMTTDLTREGIALPYGVKVYAHRGQGIGTSFNIFAIITSPTANYSVVVLTNETGSTAEAAKVNATQIISELLDEIARQMN